MAILTLTGAKLLHEGQFEGRKVRLPVFLGRRPAEPADPDLAAFYGRLLKEVQRDLFRNGDWRLCERSGWPDNPTCRNILGGYHVLILAIPMRGGSPPGTMKLP